MNMQVPAGTDDLAAMMQEVGRAAREAGRVLASTSSAQKDRALMLGAAALRASTATLLEANASDMAKAAKTDLSAAMIDRLKLDEKRIDAMARGLEDVAALPDPVGAVMAEWTRPNGLAISRVRTPLGVIGIIYESRPNVTADAGALCLKAGNAAILRGGSESFYSSRAILHCLQTGLREAGLPEAAIQMIPVTDRAAVGHLLRMTEFVDVIVPRGGKGLIARVQEESRVPVLAHLDGNNHVYVHAAADVRMARQVVMNAKMRRVSVCGAAETLLVDRAIVATHLKPLVDDLIAAGCEVRGDAATRAINAEVKTATDADWATEYLEPIIAVRVVDGVDEAVAHVERWGSHHTDAIVTADEAAAERFLSGVDSAIVLWNASTQFADGAEFGMGAEIGIATGRLHARGPVGAEQLTTFKYVVRGSGQTRP